MHVAETVGAQEKCVDISLAVEMLHYASEPDAFELAALLTGDKDFMPAMSRTRQKGKRVALVSMRNGCNQALVAPRAHVRDFAPVWLDDHLSEEPLRRRTDLARLVDDLHPQTMHTPSVTE